jgi:glycosyltransferase involved in cell wall biosynthesis
MKITWLSNAPWAKTGYGNQTGLFTPRLAAMGHDVAVIAFYGLEGGILGWTANNGKSIPVYPKGFHPYGQDIMSAHTRHYGADIMISLMDAWVVQPEMVVAGVKWVPWFPVDMEPLPPLVAKNVRRAWKRIVFSMFGQRMVNDAGMDCYYVPHGVDTRIFKPEALEDARQALGLPIDRYIVGMVAANKGQPSRKAFMPQIEAFAQFVKKHPEAMLYLHTTKGEANENGGANLVEFVRYMGIEKSVIFCDQYANMLGYPDDYMRQVYSALDVHMLVSMGEGFGIPILEAQACGCPVITGDWTAMSEITFSGWKVHKEDADKWWTPLGAYQWQPRIGAIVDRLESAYRMSGNQDYRERARDGVMKYDADRVAERYWKPTLEGIQTYMVPKLAMP